MQSFRWSGRLTLPMRLLVETNNLLSLLIPRGNDPSTMKERVRKGYEAEFSDHVRRYDELGFQNQDRAARIQLEGLPFRDARVLDVGCGTGAVSQVAFEHGARSVTCGDISAFMLHAAKEKGAIPQSRYRFCQLDAESLPFEDRAFDATVSGMTFGTLPNQGRVANEMVRVTRSGGLVCIGAHGPDHYWEAIDATLRCINKRYVIGYRFEWWPRTEEEMRNLLKGLGLEGIQSRRIVWRNDFSGGGEAYDFFAAISSSWWYAKFPADEIARDSMRTRAYFERKSIATITDDIVVAYGFVP